MKKLIYLMFGKSETKKSLISHHIFYNSCKSFTVPPLKNQNYINSYASFFNSKK